MRLVCPNCASPYEVPDRLLAGKSRKLRCARCGTVWEAEAQAANPLAPEPETLAASAPEAPADSVSASMRDADPDMASGVGADARRPAGAALRRGGPRVEDPERDLPMPIARPRPAPARTGAGLLVLAWVASFAVLAGIVAAFVLFQEPIVEAWPAAQRLYRWAAQIFGAAGLP